MKINSFFSRICHSPIPRHAIMMVALITLAWSSLAFCGEVHDATRGGDLEKVKALLKKNPDLVLSKDDIGATPLHYAAQYGQNNVAELLLNNKADVNAKAKSLVTPLHLAAQRGYQEMAALLLANKAEVNAKSSFGWTPLYVAAQNGHKEVATLLSQHGGHE
jgi:ankyrin repeat protein